MAVDVMYLQIEVDKLKDNEMTTQECFDEIFRRLDNIEAEIVKQKGDQQ